MVSNQALSDEDVASPSLPLFRDIRRYYCEYCGICRSKKSLISAHIQLHHKDDIKENEMDCEDDRPRSYDCGECGASFKKPAYLKQHMYSHSSVRPFTCPVDDCSSCYRRKDHLTRHMLHHQGKLFICPVHNCKLEFTIEGNMKRHMKKFHDGNSCDIDAQKQHDGDPCEIDVQKQHTCQECGKIFKYPSQLRKHEDSHVKLDTVEAVCCEPGCFKPFSNAECLKAHMRSCHMHFSCEICGSKQLKKSMKRHLRTHEDKGSIENVKCTYEGCSHSFSNMSNLRKHIKAIHLKIRPYKCYESGCGKQFAYKHVRDNHERTIAHAYDHFQGDFLESDEQFRSRPRGGRKRKAFTVEGIFRKRVLPPGHDSVLDIGSEYLNWLISED